MALRQWLLAAVMAASFSACRDRVSPTLCIRADLGAPLAPGDTIALAAGMGGDDGCSGSPTTALFWTAGPPDVVVLDSGATLTAVGPGTFTVTARIHGDTAHTVGYVLPRDWRPRIHPVSAVIHVGDSIGFRVVPVDSAGHDLPDVPFSIETPEHVRNACDSAFVRPCRADLRRDSVGAAVTLVGARIGRTPVVGRIADRIVTGSVRVVARTDSAARR